MATVDLRVDLNTEDDTGLPWAFCVTLVIRVSCAREHGSLSAPETLAPLRRWLRLKAIWCGFARCLVPSVNVVSCSVIVVSRSHLCCRCRWPTRDFIGVATQG
jgi:hypothetical protein